MQLFDIRDFLSDKPETTYQLTVDGKAFYKLYLILYMLAGGA